MKIIRGNTLEFSPASHEDPQHPGVLKKVLATKDNLQEGRVQMVNWSMCPKGSSFRKHYHEDMQEVFVIMNGTVSMSVDGTTTELGQGDAIVIDATEVHQMTNTCGEDVHYLVFGISAGRNGKTIVVEN